MLNARSLWRLPAAARLRRRLRKVAGRVRFARDLRFEELQLPGNDGSHMVAVDDLRNDLIVRGRTVPPVVVVCGQPRRRAGTDERPRALEPRRISSFKQADRYKISDIPIGTVEHLLRNGERTTKQLIAAPT